MLGEKLKLSCIAEVPQAHLRPHLILNLPEKPDEGTTSVNDTTEREVAPELMQFGKAFPCIHQEIWEAELMQSPVWISKLDVTYVYHRGILRLS